MNCFSAPAVTGSVSLNAHRNGRSNLRKTPHAISLSLLDGSSMVTGTKVGKIRAALLNVSSGNGASYAAISSGQRAQASHIHNFSYFEHGCCL